MRATVPIVRGWKKIGLRSKQVVSAGTATSTRGRGEANSFNLLKLEKHRVEVQRFEWVEDDRRFAPAARQLFGRELTGWKPIDTIASAGI